VLLLLAFLAFTGGLAGALAVWLLRVVLLL